MHPRHGFGDDDWRSGRGSFASWRDEGEEWAFDPGPLTAALDRVDAMRPIAQRLGVPVRDARAALGARAARRDRRDRRQPQPGHTDGERRRPALLALDDGVLGRAGRAVQPMTVSAARAAGQDLDPVLGHQQRLHVARGEPPVAVEQDVLVVRHVARLPRELLERVVRQVRVADPVGRQRDAERVAADPPDLLAREAREDVLLGDPLGDVERVAGLHGGLHLDTLPPVTSRISRAPRRGRRRSRTSGRGRRGSGRRRRRRRRTSRRRARPAAGRARRACGTRRRARPRPSSGSPRGSPPRSAISRVEPGRDLQLGHARAGSRPAAARRPRRRSAAAAAHAVELGRRLDEPDAVDDPVAGDDLRARRARSRRRPRRTSGAPGALRPALDADRAVAPAAVAERARRRSSTAVVVAVEDRVVEVRRDLDQVLVALVVDGRRCARRRGVTTHAERRPRRVPDRLEAGQVADVRRAHDVAARRCRGAPSPRARGARGRGTPRSGTARSRRTSVGTICASEPSRAPTPGWSSTTSPATRSRSSRTSSRGTASASGTSPSCRRRTGWSPTSSSATGWPSALPGVTEPQPPEPCPLPALACRVRPAEGQRRAVPGRFTCRPVRAHVDGRAAPGRGRGGARGDRAW